MQKAIETKDRFDFKQATKDDFNIEKRLQFMHSHRHKLNDNYNDYNSYRNKKYGN
ncbi:MAG: hypothetical protein SPI03_06355 [Campylobacter sputorum]|uniref:hypothetical protein n=1 Tax=Campylobacter sputorum TaxID=206 RepID=UPI0013747743|nr:hypothetical protein [Campylobacter sputorum]MDY6120938.1 hypothetical protein [Campylobacter sputorum]